MTRLKNLALLAVGKLAFYLENRRLLVTSEAARSLVAIKQPHPQPPKTTITAFFTEQAWIKTAAPQSHSPPSQTLDCSSLLSPWQ
jgi:hypothetical protein